MRTVRLPCSRLYLMPLEMRFMKIRSRSPRSAFDHAGARGASSCSMMWRLSAWTLKNSSWDASTGLRSSCSMVRSTLPTSRLLMYSRSRTRSSRASPRTLHRSSISRTFTGLSSNMPVRMTLR